MIARRSDRIPERVDDLDAGKVLLVVGDNDAVIGLGDRSDGRVERAARPSLRGSLSHQAGPDQGRLFIKWQHAAGEKRRRPFRAGKPGIKLVTLPPGGFFQYAAPDFGDGE